MINLHQASKKEHAILIVDILVDVEHIKFRVTSWIYVTSRLTFKWEGGGGEHWHFAKPKVSSIHLHNLTKIIKTNCPVLGPIVK